MRRRVDALGDFLVSLAVVVWVVGGAYGAVQVLRYTYDLAGIWWVMFAVVVLPITMAIMPFVALIHDHSWSLFLGTWDALMLGWILQMAGGLLADRPRSDPSREDPGEPLDDVTPELPSRTPPSDGTAAPEAGLEVGRPPTSAPRAKASAASDESAD
jgi:hypothetical protein